MPHIVLEFDRKSTQKFIYQHRFLSHKDRETFQGKKNRKLRSSRFLKYLSGCRVLYLDLNLDTAGELKFHQGIDSLCGRAVDVDQTLVV